MKGTAENSQDKDRRLQISATVKNNPPNITTKARRKIEDAGTKSEDIAVGGEEYLFPQ